MLLVQDAVPASPAWLQALVAPLLLDEQVAGSFARQCPAPGASRLTIEYPLAMDRGTARAAHRRSPHAGTGRGHVCRRNAWSRARSTTCVRASGCRCGVRIHSVGRSIAEDLEWAREVLLAGYKLAYAADAVVSHSHERPVTYELQRTYLVHQRLHALFGLTTIPTPAGAAQGNRRHRSGERPTRGKGRDGTSSRLHSQCRARGGGAGWAVPRRALFPRRPRMAAHGAHLMRVMLVVHGFPPAAHGGTEVYVHDLAVALAALPHTEVGSADPPCGFESARTGAAPRPGRKCDGLQHQQHVPALCGFRGELPQPAAAARRGWAIDEFAPDVVHIQHLTCLSADLPGEIAARGIPVALTLNDYWLACHRGQLFDLDGARCAGPFEGGCARCIPPGALAGPQVVCVGAVRQDPAASRRSACGRSRREDRRSSPRAGQHACCNRRPIAAHAGVSGLRRSHSGALGDHRGCVPAVRRAARPAGAVQSRHFARPVRGAAAPSV